MLFLQDTDIVLYHSIVNTALYQQNKRKERRAHYIEKFGGKCEKCGSTKNLQFDHKNRSTKSFAISRYWLVSIEKLEKELAKCQLLCGDCHLKKTIQENGGAAQHGTKSMYNNHSCRCGNCKKANTNYYRDRRFKMLTAV